MNKTFECKGMTMHVCVYAFLLLLTYIHILTIIYINSYVMLSSPPVLLLRNCSIVCMCRCRVCVSYPCPCFLALHHCIISFMLDSLLLQSDVRMVPQTQPLLTKRPDISIWRSQYHCLIWQISDNTISEVKSCSTSLSRSGAHTEDQMCASNVIGRQVWW